MHPAKGGQPGPASIYEAAFTRVNVTHADASGPSVGVSNASTFRYINALAQNPLMAWMRPVIDPPAQRSIERPWFGGGIAWGDPAAFERFFDAQTQAELRVFPGNLTFVAFDGRGTASLGWRGLERDPAVVEKAFSVGAALLRNAASNGVR